MKYGYATQCHECNHIEIAFGTSLVRIPVNRLEAFVKYLNDVKRSTTAVDHNQKKHSPGFSIYVFVPDDFELSGNDQALRENGKSGRRGESKCLAWIV